MFDFSKLLIIGISLLQLQACYAELVLLQVVFRHGNRYPNPSGNIYPNDPYLNETYEPEGAGGLTNVGKMSVYELGIFLRDRYDKFLGPLYSGRQFRFYADEFDRIMMSAELAAAAMFPPSDIQRWNSRLQWQPIPVWTTPIQTDILYNGLFCTRLQKIRKNIEATDPHLVKRQRKYEKFFADLSKNVGRNITQASAFFLYHTLYMERDIGLKLPTWATESMSKLEDIASYDLIIQSYTKEMQKLMGGMWLREWLKHVDEYINSKSPIKRKAHIYAAHEINLAGILTALKSFDGRIPEYSSAILFELYHEDEEYYVKMRYRIDDETEVIDIPECENGVCLLEEFREIVAPILPSDPQKLCGKINYNLF